MNDKLKNTEDNRLLEAAVRRAVGVKFVRPSLRSMLRACAVYANVIAAVVALGLPTVGAVRRAANSAMIAFESSVRTAGDASNAGSNLLESPVDLSGVTEASYGAPESAESPRIAPVFTPTVKPEELMSFDTPAPDAPPADSFAGVEVE